MGEKSNSTSQLSDAGRSRRVGLFGARQKSITVHRSEEVMPDSVVTGVTVIGGGLGGGAGGSVGGGSSASSTTSSRLLVRQV